MSKVLGLCMWISFQIGDVYKDMDMTMKTLPADDVQFDPQAYKAAIAEMRKVSNKQHQGRTL